MTLTSVGDKGQRFEICADGYPLEGKRCVIGWTDKLEDAASMATSTLQAPGCTRVAVRDRWERKDDLLVYARSGS